MSAEEVFKNLSESAKKAAANPAEAPPPGPDVLPPDGTPPVEGAPSRVSFIPAAKESMDAFAKRLKEKLPATAAKIVSPEDKPQDQRVLQILQDVLVADEMMLSDPGYMRTIGERLVGVVWQAGMESPTGEQAYRYLNRIISEQPDLAYLRDQARMEIPLTAQAAADMSQMMDGEQIAEEIDRLYDEKDDPLKDSVVGEELHKLQQKLQWDPVSMYDPRSYEEPINQIMRRGRETHADSELIKAGVQRIREVQNNINVVQSKRLVEERGYVTIHWRDVAGAPNQDMRSEDASLTFRALTTDEVAKVISGDKGEADWFFNFCDQIYSMGREQSRPTLAQEYKWEDFKDFLEWKYGGEYRLAVQRYLNHWENRSQYEYITKGLLYNPGDLKDRLKAMQLLQAADLDHLYKNYDYSNFATTLYEQRLTELMAEKKAKHQETLSYLREEIDNPFGGEKIRRDKLLGELQKKHRAEGIDPATGKKRESPLTLEQQELMHEIAQAHDLAAEGVMLWDSDVQSYTEMHEVLNALKGRRQELTQKQSRGETLSAGEIEEMEEINRKYKVYSHREKLLNEDFNKELLETRGLSPLDIEVRKRLIDYIKATAPQDLGPDGEIPEWKLRMAIWAARTAIIGSGRMAMIGAMNSTRPAVEYVTSSGKDVMRSPAFEDLQRIFNPEVFAHRFHMGGQLGETARSILRTNLVEKKGMVQVKAPWWVPDMYADKWKRAKISKTKEWKHKKHELEWVKDHHDQNEFLYAMEAMEFAEETTGIAFAELLGPGFMSTGGFYDGTIWRLEKGVVDTLRERMLEMRHQLPEGAKLLDNQALSIQLQVASSPDQRMPILDRMLRRNPSKFLHLIANETSQILEKRGVSKEEWQAFKEALSLSEIKMYSEKELKYARVDLATKEDFASIVYPFLKRLGISEDRGEVLRVVLSDMQDVMYSKKEGQFSSKMAAIANFKLPLTPSMTDFDWKDTNFFQLGAVAMHRRIRDIGFQAQARDGILGIISNQENLLSPNDPAETIKKLQEIREAIINYSGTGNAEPVVYELARMVIEVNRHRSLWTVGMVPGLTGIMKLLAEIDPKTIRNNVFFKLIFGSKRWDRLSKTKVEHWPHSIAQAISYSLRYTGAHGNVWDENKIEEFINTMHDKGLFVDHPQFVHDLRTEFKTKFLYRMLAIPRKYWWLIPIATIAMAATQSIEEQKKGSSH